MTNLAGLISPSVIYLFPPNGFASWGMSSATFAALGFGMAGCAYASLKGLDELKSYAAPYRWYFLALLGLTLFGAALFSLALNKSLEVDAVHATSFLIGLATGSLAIARTAPSAPRVAPPYQDR